MTKKPDSGIKTEVGSKTEVTRTTRNCTACIPSSTLPSLPFFFLRKQRFMGMPLKGETIPAQEHSTVLFPFF
jgi:hypothetical protein